MRALILAVLVLVGCDEKFRYPCQDPKNWDQDACQRPGCAINGVCPDQLNRPTDMKLENER